jgi:hypothetical protein
VPGSPADGVLEPGDVLVRAGGEVVSHFLHLEELLDGAVGSPSIELHLERGGQPLVVSLPVTDLHGVTPARMLEVAGGSVHALSYQQARNNRWAGGLVGITGEVMHGAGKGLGGQEREASAALRRLNPNT